MKGSMDWTVLRLYNCTNSAKSDSTTLKVRRKIKIHQTVLLDYKDLQCCTELSPIWGNGGSSSFLFFFFLLLAIDPYLVFKIHALLIAVSQSLW